MRNAVYFVKSSLFLTLLVSIFLLAGCKPKLIPSTNVPPTRENQKVVKFLEQFKAAVDKQNVQAIMELVAKDFRDNMGSEDPSLQMDYLTLKERLEKSLARAKDMRLGIFVQHIAKIEPDVYETVFYFTRQSLMELPSGEKWFSKNEVVRMVIRRRHDKGSPYEFEILQGI